MASVRNSIEFFYWTDLLLILWLRTVNTYGNTSRQSVVPQSTKSEHGRWKYFGLEIKKFGFVGVVVTDELTEGAHLDVECLGICIEMHQREIPPF